MQNAKKWPLHTTDYSPLLVNMQESEKNEKKYMIFLIFVLICWGKRALDTFFTGAEENA